MTRRAIVTIIISMSIALLGLIGFQLYWINNAINLSQERFHKDVQESLRNVSAKLELNEMLVATSNSFIMEEIKDGSTWITKDDEDAHFAGATVVVDSRKKKIRFKSNQNEVHEQNVHTNVVVDSTGAFTETILISVGENDTMVVDRAKVANKSMQFGVVVKEMLKMENDIAHRVHPIILDSLLEEEFAEKGITIKYEYGVFNTEENKFVLADYTNEEDLLNSPLKASLFPNDLLANVNYLTVNFPQQDQFLLKKVWATLASSLVLIGIVVFAFAYAIKIILRQKKLSDIKNDFINNMTHEFKTPIATVSLATEALHEDAISGNQDMRERYLKVIGAETKRLESQVEKVLDAAQLERDDFKLHFEKINVLDLVRTAMDASKFRAEELGGQITVSSEATSTKTEGDSAHLLQVIQNLLDNAIKYRSEIPEINIRLTSNNDEIEISIEDKGIGISKDDQKHVFDKFYRVSTGNVHNIKGFGLGLSYVKTIMTEHGGSVHLKSDPGKGSIFTISLPYKTNHA